MFVSHGGKRASKKVGDKRAAEIVASKIRAKLKLGEFNITEPKEKPIPLFKDFVKSFMETCSVMNHKISTRESYKSVLDKHLLPYFGEMSLDSITKKDVRNFIYSKVNAKLAPNTVKKYKKVSQHHCDGSYG